GSLRPWVLEPGELGDVGPVGVEPIGPPVGWEDDRDGPGERGEERVRAGRDQRAGVDRLAVRRLPGVPDGAEREERAVAAADVVRPAAVWLRWPEVEAGGGDEAAPASEEVPQTGLPEQRPCGQTGARSAAGSGVQVSGARPSGLPGARHPGPGTPD